MVSLIWKRIRSLDLLNVVALIRIALTRARKQTTSTLRRPKKSPSITVYYYKKSPLEQVSDQGTQKACLYFKISLCKCVKWVYSLNKCNFDFTKFSLTKKVHHDWRSLRIFNRLFCWKSELHLNNTNSSKKIIWNIK
jgi:hypothetical protein